MREARLIKRAKRGNPAALAGLYDRYRPSIYRYAFYRLGEIGEAENVTGEVFLRLVESIDRCPQQAGLPLVWLHGIAEDLIRKRRQRTGDPPRLPLEPYPVTGSTAGGEAAKQPPSPQRLAAALACLTSDQAQVILLKFIEGLTDEAVARALDEPVEAVQSLGLEALAAFAVALAWCDAVQASGLPRTQQQELERLLQEGIQNLVHELRSPLSLIQGYADLLLRKALGPIRGEQRDALGIIYDQTKVLSSLIGSLTAARGIPRAALALAPLSASRLLESTVRRCRPVAEQAGVQLETQLAEDLPAILGDEEHLTGALLQILRNAIKFSPGGGTVQVRAWADESWLYISVQDQGIGIAPEHLERVFDPFWQADGSPSRRFGGVGLGLAVAGAVAEAHGGRIWAASEGPDTGSTFTLALPMALEESPLPSRAASPGRRPGSEPGISHALDACLLQLQEGQVGLDECLATYPDLEADLRPYLEVALELQRAPRPASSYAAFAGGKRRMLEALASRQRGPVVSLAALARHRERIAALLRRRARLPVRRYLPIFRLAVRAALALVLLTTGVMFLHSLAGTTVAEAATLAQVEGVVEVVRSDGEAWQPVSVGARLEPGDRIQTGQLSAATVVFFDGSVTRLEAETEATLAQMSSRRDSGGRIIVINQWIGYTYNRVRPETEVPSRFEVQTPSVLAVVSGTEFAVAVEADGTTRVLVAEGVVNVSSEETTVAVRAGQEAVALPEEPPRAAGPVGTVTPRPFPGLSLIDAAEETPYPAATVEPTEPRGPSGGELEPTRLPGPVPTLRPTERPTPRPTPTRARPTPTPLPTATSTPRRPPTAVPPATATPTPAVRPPLTATPTFTPTATLTPTVTSTPVPTATEALTTTVNNTPAPTPTGTMTSTAATSAISGAGPAGLAGGPVASLLPTTWRAPSQAEAVGDDTAYAAPVTGLGPLVRRGVVLRTVAVLVLSAACGLGILGRGLGRVSLPGARCTLGAPVASRRGARGSLWIRVVAQRQTLETAPGSEWSRSL